MSHGLEAVCAAALVLAFAATSEAQQGGIPRRVSALERAVAAQDERIGTLEGQVSSLTQTIAGLQTQLSSTAGRLAAVESSLRYQVFEVDCDAGGSLGSVLGHVPATVPFVRITVSGTCREGVTIDRDNVVIQGTPGATVDAPPEYAWGIFVNGGRDIRLDHLTIRSPHRALHIRAGHVEGSDLRLVGGVAAMMGSIVRFYRPTVIESSPSSGVAVSEESQFTIFGCEILDSADAGVLVDGSTFEAGDGCRIERSGRFGLLAQNGANVLLDTLAVTASGETGVEAALGSAIHFRGVVDGSRISGSPVGLKASGGSSVRLARVRIDGNGDGVSVADSSVVARDPWSGAQALEVTANSGAGVRCAPPPAVPQLVDIDAQSVFGNAGGDIVCAGY